MGFRSKIDIEYEKKQNNKVRYLYFLSFLLLVMFLFNCVAFGGDKQVVTDCDRSSSSIYDPNRVSAPPPKFFPEVSLRYCRESQEKHPNNPRIMAMYAYALLRSESSGFREFQYAEKLSRTSAEMGYAFGHVVYGYYNELVGDRLFDETKKEQHYKEATRQYILALEGGSYFISEQFADAAERGETGGYDWAPVGAWINEDVGYNTPVRDYILGVCLFYGAYCEKYLEKSVQLLESSASSGVPGAALRYMQIMHKKLEGEQTSENLALFEKSIEYLSDTEINKWTDYNINNFSDVFISIHQHGLSILSNKNLDQTRLNSVVLSLINMFAEGGVRSANIYMIKVKHCDDKSNKELGETLEYYNRIFGDLVDVDSGNPKNLQRHIDMMFPGLCKRGNDSGK